VTDGQATAAEQGEQDSDEAKARALVGHVLDDKWTLERLLGAGAMGAVYAARHRNGARAAVKLLHPELARATQVRERFLREGYAANRVEHPGAVRVLDDDVVKSGPDEGTAYLVMELLEGETLDDRIERGERIEERELLTILDEVLGVLEAAHANGVVHRDLKPANLFLARVPDRPYTVKVLDFGLARLEEQAGGTRAGLPMGTPSFMSPEQAGGLVDEIDGRTDLFALGATAFLVASGQHVHDAPGMIEIVIKMGTEPAPKLRDVAPEVSPGLAAIIDRALAFRREDRYPNAAAMRAEVRAYREVLERGGVSGRPSAEPSPASAKPTATAPGTESPRPVEEGKRRGGVWLAAIAVAFVAAAVGAFLVFRAGGVSWLASAGRGGAGAGGAGEGVSDAGNGAAHGPGAGAAASIASDASTSSTPTASADAAVGASDVDGGELDVVAVDAGAGDAGDAGVEEDDEEEEDAGVAAAAADGGKEPSATSSGARPKPRATTKPVHKKSPKKKLRPLKPSR